MRALEWGCGGAQGAQGAALLEAGNRGKKRETKCRRRRGSGMLRSEPGAPGRVQPRPGRENGCVAQRTRETEGPRSMRAGGVAHGARASAAAGRARPPACARARAQTPACDPKRNAPKTERAVMLWPRGVARRPMSRCAALACRAVPRTRQQRGHAARPSHNGACCAVHVPRGVVTSCCQNCWVGARDSGQAACAPAALGGSKHHLEGPRRGARRGSGRK